MPPDADNRHYDKQALDVALTAVIEFYNAVIDDLEGKIDRLQQQNIRLHGELDGIRAGR